jgi:hypothetical protein
MQLSLRRALHVPRNFYLTNLDFFVSTIVYFVSSVSNIVSNTLAIRIAAIEV